MSRVGLMVTVLAAASLLGDRLLGWAGFPSDPYLQLAHPPNLTETRKGLEYEYIFQTNGEGLRYRELALAKSSGSLRVYVAGDSYTEGVGVNAGERFTDLLEQEFSRPGREADFINGGISGGGALEYGRMFVGVGLGYNPDALLICLFANDLSNTDKDVGPGLLHATSGRVEGSSLPYRLWPRSYVVVDKWLQIRRLRERSETSDLVALMRERNRQIYGSEEAFEKWRARLPPDLLAAANRGEFSAASLATALINPAYWTNSLDLDTETAQRKFDAMTGLLRETVSTARRSGLRSGLVYIPAPYQFEPERHDPRNRDPWLLTGVAVREQWLTGESELQRRLQDFCAREGIVFLDLTPVLRAESKGRKLTFALDGHFNPAGHKVVARALAQWLRAHRLIPD